MCVCKYEKMGVVFNVRARAKTEESEGESVLELSKIPKTKRAFFNLKCIVFLLCCNTTQFKKKCSVRYQFLT